MSTENNTKPLIIETDYDGDDQFLIRMKRNGRTLNTGRGYNRKANADKTLDSIIEAIRSGNFVRVDKTRAGAEQTPEPVPEPTPEEAQTGLNFRNIAALGYEAYSKSTGNKNFRGEEMPNFEDLPTAIINAWIAAAKEIVDVAVRAATA